VDLSVKCETNKQKYLCRIDPFEHCSVKNCEITYDDKALESADIVIFHLHRMVNGELPKTNRSSSQIWAFLTDESPFQTFLGKNSLINYNGVFNWSMTYRYATASTSNYTNVIEYTTRCLVAGWTPTFLSLTAARC
jgi:hypothetical protein